MPFTFSSLTALTNLDLSYNLLDEIQLNDLIGLSSLTVLELNNNQIQSITNNAFLNLANLRALELSQNRIKSISKGTVNGLVMLENLSLRANLIEDIDIEIFEIMPNIQKIDMEDNEVQLQYILSPCSGKTAVLTL